MPIRLLRFKKTGDMLQILPKDKTKRICLANFTLPPPMAVVIHEIKKVACNRQPLNLKKTYYTNP